MAYVMAAQPLFEDLRQVAAQLAGLLVLAATGSKDSTPDHPMLAASRQVLAQAEDGVMRTGALVTESAQPHYRAVVEAAHALSQALERAGGCPLDVDAVLAPLRTAYTRLQDGAAALPGFQVVLFEQACCAVISATPTSPSAGC